MEKLFFKQEKSKQLIVYMWRQEQNPGILLVQAQNAYPLANQWCCFKLITFTHLNMSLVELCNSVSHETSVWPNLNPNFGSPYVSPGC